MIRFYHYQNLDRLGRDDEALETLRIGLEKDPNNFINMHALVMHYSFKKDKETKWEYEIRGSNLLNVSSQIRNNANSVSVFNSTTFIQPRFITIRAIYQL